MDFDADGACILTPDVKFSDIEALRREFEVLDFKAGARPFALSGVVLRLLSATGAFGQALTMLGKPFARPVRVLAFDKTPENNWNLGWHQDRVIAVKRRVEHDGFENWTIKGGVHHVQPPAEFMAELFTLRFHLDDCGEDNGALRVIAGSHLLGKLRDLDVQDLASKADYRFCAAKMGQILAMKTLAVHASSPSHNPSHRRVLHVDYCTASLPEGMDWALDF